MSRKQRKIFFALVLILIGVIIGVFLTSKISSPGVSEIDSNNLRLNIEKYGAIGSDEIEDTKFIQEAINSAQKENRELFFPKGTYYIDATKSMNLKSGITILFEKGVILKALPNNKESYEIIKIHNVEDIALLGEVTIIGERDEHIGNEGEWGFGISIRGSENVYIENPIIKNNWGDGIYVGSTKEKSFSEDISIVNPLLENNRRQGISIVSAVNITILNPIIKNTYGTAPAAGIDLEPNKRTERMKGVNIINMVSENNAGGGVAILLQRLEGSTEYVDITITNTEGVRDGMRVSLPDRLKGIIKIGNEYKLNNF